LEQKDAERNEEEAESEDEDWSLPISLFYYLTNVVDL
jgi:hypothetical protein